MGLGQVRNQASQLLKISEFSFKLMAIKIHKAHIFSFFRKAKPQHSFTIFAEQEPHKKYTISAS